MNIRDHIGKIAAVAAAGLVIIAVAAAIWLVPKAGSNSPPAEPVGPDLAAISLAKCDTLASDPSDPNRYSAPVPDAQFALGAALAACTEAVQRNPKNARALFELGRANWIARRDKDAFTDFVYSDQMGYTAAKKYIGDAYALDRGLPSGANQNWVTALKWYQDAYAAGYIGAKDAMDYAQLQIAKNTFDRSKFQQSDYMEILYNGDFSNVQSPMGLAYYVQGIVGRLDNENTVFMDQKCKPLVDALGGVVVDNAQLFAIAKIVYDRQAKGSNDYSNELLRAFMDFIGGDTWSNYGSRDAVVLFDKDTYGCDSAVTKKILGNIMLRFQIGDSNKITVSTDNGGSTGGQ